MRAAIRLVERLGGVVAGRRGQPGVLPWGVTVGSEPPARPAGVAAVCIEDSEGARWIRERYKCAHCVPPRLQPRFDRHQTGWE